MPNTHMTNPLFKKLFKKRPYHQPVLPGLSKTDKGFTLFVAVLVSSLVLAVGFSISNIVLKQIAISGAGGGSLSAFYAADSAIECALYWDRKKADGSIWESSPFGTSTPVGFDPNIPASAPQCGPNNEIKGWTQSCDNGICDSASVAATTTFSVDFKDPLDARNLACASVSVNKWTEVSTGEERTTIISRGYNTDLINSGSVYGCNLSRQRVVERGLMQTY